MPRPNCSAGSTPRNDTAADSTRWNKAESRGTKPFRPLLGEPDVLAEPVCDPCLVNVSRSDREHGLHSIVDVGWAGVPVPPVEINEQDQARLRGAFVAVEPSRPRCTNRCL